jgi:aldehyde dehydrogenase (NAD+)
MQELLNVKNNQRKFFYSGQTLEYDFRINALLKLKKSIMDNEDQIIESLQKDLGKPLVEIYTNEILMAIGDINYAVKNLKKWMKPEKARGAFMTFPSRNLIVNEPYGLCLIIGPWNYPFQLTLVPLIGAISAGNCCIIKPSEISSHSSDVISKIINKTFNSSYLYSLRGDAKVSSFLLDQEFDKIFFTGSPNIGRIVMEKASKYLTPVTLELGGKSPCIIDKNIDLNLTVKRMLWGKVLNAGQTCIAPDYLIVHKNIKNDLYKTIRKQLNLFFGDQINKSPDYGKIINEKHFNRIKEYFKDGNIIIGGEYNDSSLFIEPTFIEVDDLSKPVMNEEIFGPVMPVIEYTKDEEVFNIIDRNRNPLSLYIFSSDKNSIRKFSAIQSGMLCINNTVVNVTNHNLPFGGRGKSGIGNYHGKFSFNAFSHEKAVLNSSLKFDLKLKYPPYKDGHKYIKKFMIK